MVIPTKEDILALHALRRRALQDARAEVSASRVLDAALIEVDRDIAAAKTLPDSANDKPARS